MWLINLVNVFSCLSFVFRWSYGIVLYEIFTLGKWNFWNFCGRQEVFLAPILLTAPSLSMWRNLTWVKKQYRPWALLLLVDRRVFRNDDRQSLLKWPVLILRGWYRNRHYRRYDGMIVWDSSEKGKVEGRGKGVGWVGSYHRKSMW